MKHFQNSIHHPFPFVVGCVDGIHFNISMPMQDAASYYSPKGKYTIIMQAICDSKFRFLDVFIGYPGSCENAYVWKMSPIFKAITSGRVKVAENAVLLGNSSYSLSKFLMTPYDDNGHITSEVKRFNYYLNLTYMFVQQTYEIFQKKFTILKYINLGSVAKASKVIYPCAILHNFIINRENHAEYNIDKGNNFNTEETLLNCAVYREGDESDAVGNARRSNLTAMFCSK